MLLPIGVLILLGMAGTVLYNQLAGMYNDAVQANRDWTQALGALQSAISQLPDPQLAATWTEKASDPQAIANLVLSPSHVPGTLLSPLRNGQAAYQRWQETLATYDVTRQRFPASVLAKAFKFTALNIN